LNLRTPGPTPIPANVREALSGQMVDHRGPEFRELLVRVTQRLQTLFETRNDVLTLTTSGTGALEAVIVNSLSPGEQALAVSIGAFGQRFGRIAETYGADVRWLNVEWGDAASAGDVDRALDENPDVTAVLVTHNETSTGVTNPLGEIASVVKGRNKLLLVDAVSSLGSLPCPVDEWGLDVVATGSQKGWMIPPGLAMVSVSERGWEAQANAKMPRFYFDLAAAKRYLEQGQTPWTPAIPLFFAMDVALAGLIEEGIKAIQARHARAGARVRARVKDIALDLFPSDERYASNTVTAIRVPDGVDVGALRKRARDDFGVVLAGGQARLSESIFRIGHLGHIPDADLDEALDAVEGTLPKVGFEPPAGRRSS
jgi:aspartate aminotransferase-like enzyme